jgi:hypothetical protein
METLSKVINFSIIIFKIETMQLLVIINLRKIHC